MEPMDNVHTFTAIRGVQAGREYYVAMCPLKVVPKIFLFDTDELGAELRAQRTLNKARVPEIAAYVVENPRSYIFSSITASVDGRVEFQPYSNDGTGRNVGRLLVPMTARFLINDGQHRRAALEEALKARPELGEETLSVVFFVDAGLKRSQQMFADLNRHAVRPALSLGILYDHRDPLAQLARRLVEDVSVFRNITETEKTAISPRSNKLHTLSGIYQATRTLLGKRKKPRVTSTEGTLAVEFWEAVGANIADWRLAAEKKISCAELRRDCVHAHGIALEALGIVGAELVKSEANWKRKLRILEKIDWSRSNHKVWEGRALVSGRVSKAQVNVQLTANLIKLTLGLELSEKERQLEAILLRDRKRGAHAA